MRALAGNRVERGGLVNSAEVSGERLVHMTTNFALQPSGALADNIARLLWALSRHNDRHGAVTGEDMYARAPLSAAAADSEARTGGVAHDHKYCATLA